MTEDAQALYDEKFRQMRESLAKNAFEVLRKGGKPGNYAVLGFEVALHHDWRQGPVAEIPADWMRNGKPAAARADITDEECAEIFARYTAG